MSGFDRERPKAIESVQLPMLHYLNNKSLQLVDRFSKCGKALFEVDDSIVDVLFSFFRDSLGLFFLIDDIEDSSQFRNGLPTAHLIYGVSSTVQSVFFHHNKAINQLVSGLLKLHCDPKLVQQMIKEFSLTINEAWMGQGLEIYHQLADICPTLDEYLDISKQKNCNYLNTWARFYQLLGKKKEKTDFSPYFKQMFLYAQIKNDLDNLDKENNMNKGFLEDFTEGKYSFPIRHAVATFPEDKLVDNIRRLRTNDRKLKQQAVDHMRKLGSFDFTRKYLNQMKSELKLQEAQLNLPISLSDFLDNSTEN